MTADGPVPVIPEAQIYVCPAEQFHASIAAALDSLPPHMADTRERMRHEYMAQLLLCLIPAGYA